MYWKLLIAQIQYFELWKKKPQRHECFFSQYWTCWWPSTIKCQVICRCSCDLVHISYICRTSSSKANANIWNQITEKFQQCKQILCWNNLITLYVFIWYLNFGALWCCRSSISGPILEEVMVCHLFGTKPSPEPTLTSHHLDLLEQMPMKLVSKFEKSSFGSFISHGTNFKIAFWEMWL